MRQTWTCLCLFVFLVNMCAHAYAQHPRSERDLEEKAHEISKQLQCAVCQGQSIYDSTAPLAADMRLLVRDQLRAGDSPAQILSAMESRYGTRVLLRTPMRPGTYLLWMSPLLFGGMAVALAWGIFFPKRHGQTSPQTAAGRLDVEEQAALTQLRQLPTQERDIQEKSNTKVG